MGLFYALPKDYSMTEKKKLPITILSPVAKYRAEQNSKSIQLLAECGHFDIALVEAFGFSEVARARNHVATRAYAPVKERGGLVLWLDADMVIPSLPAFCIHVEAVLETSAAISGRYVTRQDETKIAASVDDDDERPLKVLRLPKVLNSTLTLTPAMTGLGCLLLPSCLFIEQVEKSPYFKKADGTKEYLVCCPSIIKKDDHHVMISEDFAYCRTLGGVWLGHVDMPDGNETYFDYGHIAERVLMHALIPHLFRDDR